MKMGFVEVEETIKKKVTVIRKTIVDPSDEVIIAIPKKSLMRKDD